MQDRYFSDEELVAFLDGEEEFAPVDDIALMLETDQALRTRLEALAIDREALAGEFADLKPSKTVLPQIHLQVAPRRGLWGAVMAGAVAASLAVGYLFGTSQPQGLNGWDEYVAAYQALYSNSTLAHVSNPPEVLAAELERVGASIGKDIPLDSLTVFPDVEYRRAQILSFEGQALIQLAFLTSTGEPVALCVIRSEDGQEIPAEMRQMEGLSTAFWAKNGYEYLLIGGTDDALIQRMSSVLSGMNV